MERNVLHFYNCVDYNMHFLFFLHLFCSWMDMTELTSWKCFNTGAIDGTV